MARIRFECNYRKSEKTVNECYECSKHGRCELFRDMSAEEEDRARDHDDEESDILLPGMIPIFS